MSNDDIDSSLEKLPEEVASALMEWRKCTLERERLEAFAYIRLRGEDSKKTIKEIEAELKTDESIYKARIEEIEAEGNYNFLHERLMSVKKRASLRTAY